MRKNTTPSPFRNQKRLSSIVYPSILQQSRKNSIDRYQHNISPLKNTFNNRHNSFTGKHPQITSLHYSIPIVNEVNKKNFQQLYIIGIGGFGRVWKVKYKQQCFAMKEMSKALVLYKKSVQSVMNELKFLQNLNHQFIVNIVAAFQDKSNIYLVLDYLSGGDLRYHLGLMKRFDEEQTTLEYLHQNNIMHRDLKPENLIMDSKGYLRLTDLGVAKSTQSCKLDTSGTPGYMAPEVMCGLEHGIEVDFFALGVIAFELMNGKRPYQGANRKEIRDQMITKQVQIKQKIEGWSIEAIDFINRLIQRKPSNRLIDVKNHPWFFGFQWEKLLKRKLTPPYVPLNNDNFDIAQIEYEDMENQQIINQTQFLLEENQHAFDNYQQELKLKQKSSFHRCYK